MAIKAKCAQTPKFQSTIVPAGLVTIIPVIIVALARIRVRNPNIFKMSSDFEMLRKRSEVCRKKPSAEMATSNEADVRKIPAIFDMHARDV